MAYLFMFAPDIFSDWNEECILINRDVCLIIFSMVCPWTRFRPEVLLQNIRAL